MLKNRTIAIAGILLALAQENAAFAATPVTTIRVASRPTQSVRSDPAPGDFDRAFVMQQTEEIRIPGLPVEEFLNARQPERSTTASPCSNQQWYDSTSHTGCAIHRDTFAYCAKVPTGVLTELRLVSDDLRSRECRER